MAYLHNEKHEEYVSLHDCRADRVELKDGVLRFWFPEGFWVLSSHPENPTGKTVRTDAARVDFVLRDQRGDDVSVDVFTRLKFPFALRRTYELSPFMEMLNRPQWELEFLYQYRDYWNRIIECWLWMPKRMRHKECQLKLDVSEVIYRWNSLRPEEEW